MTFLNWKDTIINLCFIYCFLDYCDFEIIFKTKAFLNPNSLIADKAQDNFLAP